MIERTDKNGVKFLEEKENEHVTAISTESRKKDYQLEEMDEDDSKYRKPRHKDTSEMVDILIKIMGIIATVSSVSCGLLLFIFASKYPDDILVNPAASQKLVTIIFMIVILSISIIMLFFMRNRPEGKVIVLVMVVYVSGGMSGFILFTLFEQLSRSP